MIDLARIGTLTICSSSKFYGAAQGLAKKLAGAGITVYTPRFDFDEEVVEVTKDDKIKQARDHAAARGPVLRAARPGLALRAGEPAQGGRSA